VSPPAAIVSPGPEWVIANTQLGAQLHGRVQLTVTFITGRVAAGASLTALEDLIEAALPALIPQHWLVTAIGQPFGLTIAGTEYLAADATITRSLILS
jgi:predicted oxidoreductase (fatty acid repression mutant protein)